MSRCGLRDFMGHTCVSNAKRNQLICSTSTRSKSNHCAGFAYNLIHHSPPSHAIDGR